MDLIKYLPPFYLNSEEVKNIQNSIDSENKKVKAATKNLLNQFFVDTATWGLDYWEKTLKLQTDRNKTLENRRARIKTKLRGQGTITVKLIKNVSESYNNGEVDVIEHNNEYYFTIKFIARDGIPENLTDLKAAIEEIKPAHLGVKYDFKFLIWDALDSKSLTWDELDKLNLSWDIFETGIW